jgi:hypothetical protein
MHVVSPTAKIALKALFDLYLSSLCAQRQQFFLVCLF